MNLLRQKHHDDEQAARRTPEQNRAIIDVIEGAIAGGENAEGVWAYSDVPPEGGIVDIQTPSGTHWMVDEHGLVWSEC